MIRLTDGQSPFEADAARVFAGLEGRQATLDRRRRAAQLARKRRRARIRRNRAIAALVLLGIAGLLWVTLSSAGAIPRRANAIAPAPLVVTSHLQSVHTIPGHLGAFPWPAVGQGAVAVLGTGVMASSPSTPTVPIASLTKMMTAYLTLAEHPLREGQEGPTLTMTSADVADYVHADSTDESNVPVQLGEHLSEQQLLEALLIPSADNIADLLAIWDAGSVRAFVTKMNNTAKVLGLHATHYADASGVNPSSRSNAIDQAILAAALMRNPVVRGIVSKSQLAFPVAGTIWNFNPGLGTDGIIGVKSGFTSQASGCLATAAYRAAGGQHVLVVAVALGQPMGLGEAAQVDEGLLGAAGRSLVRYRVPMPNASIGDLVTAGTKTPLALTSAPVLVGWPGLQIYSRIEARTKAVGPRRAPVVADLVVSSTEGSLAKVPVTAPTIAPRSSSGSSTRSSSG